MCTAPCTCLGPAELSERPLLSLLWLPSASLGWPTLQAKLFLPFLRRPLCLGLCCSLHQERTCPLFFSLIMSVLQALAALLHPPGNLLKPRESPWTSVNPHAPPAPHHTLCLGLCLLCLYPSEQTPPAEAPVTGCGMLWVKVRRESGG